MWGMVLLAPVLIISTTCVTLAATENQFGDLQANLAAFGKLVNTATAIAVALAFLYFFWNLGTYVLGGGEKKDEAKRGMMWGVIALVVLTSLWGIIIFIRNVIGIDAGKTNPIQLPTVTNKT